MDEMDLEGTPAQQPDDPFGGDAAVTSEQQPAQTEQTVQAEPVTEEAQAQPQEQPAAEAVKEEKPKWQKIIGKITPILIAVAGILAALFMCLLSIQSVSVSIFGGKTIKSLMLKDVSDSINKTAEAMANLSSDAPTSAYAGYMSAILLEAYIVLAMLMGIVTGIICGIMLIVKTIQQYAVKKNTTLEKTAITSCLFFFADSAILLSLSTKYVKDGSDLMGINQYGAATLAGLIIVGILFAVYFIGKILADYQRYFEDKTKLINGCMNLAWAVIAMLALALLTCAPVMAAEDGGSTGYGFNYVFANAFREVLANAENKNADLSSEASQYMYAAIGMVIQIWFIFQCGKSLHGAMRGTIAANKAVKLGSQIWRLVFAVLYLIISAALSKEFFGDKASISLAAPVMIFVFSIIGLVLAIVNKVIVKEKANKQEI